MPRTILTDDIIEKKCPEYQPLGLPNAYFDNVGGKEKSEGIKPTPIRPPPRPARIQYLSANANIPLEELRNQVSKKLDNAVAEPVLLRTIAQPVVRRITQPALQQELEEELETKEAEEEEEEFFDAPKPLEEQAEEEEKEVVVLTRREELQQVSKKIGEVIGKLDELSIKGGDRETKMRLEKELAQLRERREELKSLKPSGRAEELSVKQIRTVREAGEIMKEVDYLATQAKFEEGIITGTRIEEYRPREFMGRTTKERFERIRRGEEETTIERAQYLQEKGYFKTGPSPAKKSPPAKLRGSPREET